MDELNKNQLVLLCILVSFVVSIATGILTVSLMNEAPLTVTQTINRVVERTIEKVVPGQTQIKEVSVVTTEEDLILKVIKTAVPSVAQINFGGQPAGTGFFVASDLVATDFFTASTTNQTYQITLGKRKFDAQVIAHNNDLAILKVMLETTEKGLLDLGGDKAVVSMKLSEGGPVIGQTVVGVDGKSTVSVGIISSLSGEATPTIATTNAATSENHGGPLLNIKGEVIGISEKQGLAISAMGIRAVLDTIK